MTRTTRHSITALLTAASLLGFAGVAAALEGEDPSLGDETPVEDVVDDTTTTTTEDDAADDVLVDDGTVDDGTDDDGTDDEPVAPESGPVDNHGAAVSTAAHECPDGPDHGPCVRDVARGDDGKPDAEADGTVEDDDVTTTSAHGNGKGKGKDG